MIERYIFASLLFLIADGLFLWLNRIHFQNQVINVQRVVIQPNYKAIIATYVFLLSGLCYFIIRTHRSVLDAFLLGVLIYGVFECTNMGIFKKWELKTVLMDTLWGGILFAGVTQLTYSFFSRA
jgi:uncharacterized membrane protein